MAIETHKINYPLAISVLPVHYGLELFVTTFMNHHPSHFLINIYTFVVSFKVLIKLGEKSKSLVNIDFVMNNRLL